MVGPWLDPAETHAEKIPDRPSVGSKYVSTQRERVGVSFVDGMYGAVSWKVVGRVCLLVT